jgi:ABC-type nickel/cobalt efflux system permease component RcnA
MMEALSWYLESLTAFWASFASGGILKLILIWWIISRICGRRGGCGGYRRRHYGCRCGCRCGHGHSHDHHGHGHCPGQDHGHGHGHCSGEADEGDDEKGEQKE